MVVGLIAAETEMLVMGVAPTSFHAIVPTSSWAAVTLAMREYVGELARAFVRDTIPMPVAVTGHVAAGAIALSKSRH